MSNTQQGFILTRRAIERNGHSHVELWLATPDGPIKVLSTAQPWLFFVETENLQQSTNALNEAGIPFESKPLALKTFAQQSVSALYFRKSAHHYQARETLNQRGIETYEDDIRLPERYLMERFVQAGVRCAGRTDRGDIICEVKPTDYHPTLTVLSLDIECSEQGELYSVGLKGEQFQRVIMIGQPEDAADWIEWVEDERQLLRALIRAIQATDPDIIVGWNVVNFDFRVLLKRAETLRVPLNIGRGGDAISWRDSRSDTNQGFVFIPGRVVIDGIDSLRSATYHFDSFSLESVAQQLLGKGKLSDDVDDRLAAITHDFHHNKVKLAEYNLQDCQLVLDIFEHTKVLDFLILRSQLTGLELDRIGGSVAAFINLYLPQLHRAGYISPNRPSDGGLASPGGYVMASRPGLYQNVLVLDFKSLYPSIIRTFKVDPLGLIEGLLAPEKGIEGFKGAVFSRDKHFLPQIITSLWQQRDEAKKHRDGPRSQAIKILMNSFYGVLGSGGCPFYDTRLASSITMRGHEIMQVTAEWIEQAGFEVIYGDTDSTFVWLEGDYDAAKAKETGTTLQVMINERWRQRIKEEFELESYLEIEFETHFEHFLMPTIRGSEQGSKKRYAGVKRSAGGTELVFKGLETVRSDWTELAKSFQRTLYEKVFAGQDVTTFIKQTIEDTHKGRFDQELVYRKRLRQKLDKYVKNVPPHVKAARLADAQNAKANKPLRYQQKGWVSYVQTTNGPEPLEYLRHPIDYDHYVDKQIRPVAEGILPFIGLSFEQISSAQLSLF